MTIEPQRDADVDSQGGLDLIVEAMPVCVLTTQADGRTTYANRRWRNFVGSSLTGDWVERIHADDRGRISGAWRNALGTKRPFEAECRLRGSDGSFQWFLVRAVPRGGDSGAIDGWIVACTEVDAMKRVEETLRRSNEDLDRVASIAAHDLQEPLRKILGFGERLAARFGPGMDEIGRRQFGRILAAAERMESLIQDVLTLSRISGQSRPFVDVDLQPIADGVKEDLEAVIERTGAALEIGPLPTIRADPGMMRRLLLNLIANALKYHRPGVPPQVFVSCRASHGETGGGSSWILEVADEGIGFDARYRETIFHPFRRLHGRREYEGAGLGLAICRRIVERHGGTIEADGESGKGAVFRVVLPAAHPPIRRMGESEAGDHVEGGVGCETSPFG